MSDEKNEKNAKNFSRRDFLKIAGVAGAVVGAGGGLGEPAGGVRFRHDNHDRRGHHLDGRSGDNYDSGRCCDYHDCSSDHNYGQRSRAGWHFPLGPWRTVVHRPGRHLRV